MANNNVYHNSANIASFSLTDPDPEPDDISVFLRHILLPSSSSSSSNLMALKGNEMQYSSPLPHLMPNNNQQGDLSSMMNSSAGGIFSSSYGAYNGATNVSSSSVGTMDNDPDEYECESEVFLHFLLNSFRLISLCKFLFPNLMFILSLSWYISFSF